MRIDRRRIAVDQDEVGPFAGLQRTDPVLGKAGIGRAPREGIECLRESQPLGRYPAAGRLAVDVLPAHGRGQAGEGIGRFHRKIRAERQLGAALEHRLPSISAGEAVRSKALLGHQPVARLMGWLHRGDDAGRGEARDVGWINDLEMLDPPAPVAAILLGQYLVG